ncbi:MAG TPA: hypothetical protein DCX08_06255 [Porticoccaceae bacterium]|jgi:hypothetical protein|nr:hypothetical protein [Porticoccaceae bacterium]|tara:strand:- start:8543 stop:8920 length:378 start_codon:yes stop_codon:yes gene_type:complete
MSILSALIEPVTGLLDKYIPDATEKQRIAFELSTISEKHAQELAVAQIELNKADAQGSWFQSSWRPLCGYVAVLGMAINFLVSPVAAGFGVVIPQADAGTLMPLLLGMLGLSGSRSLERIKGVGK